MILGRVLGMGISLDLRWDMRIRVRFRVLAFLVVSTLFHSSALAYSPVPEIKANGEFFKSDVVFTGTVLSQHYRELDVDHSGWFYRVSVAHVFKGPIQKEFVLYTEDASNRFPLENGREYLLFARRVGRRLEIDNCGNSALLSEAGKSLQQIESIKTTPDSEIEGWVVGETGGIDLFGIHVVIRSGSRVYRALHRQGRLLPDSRFQRQLRGGLQQP
jgi:hypothetical protein